MNWLSFTFLLVSMSLQASNDLESSPEKLKACEDKISELLAQIPSQEVKVLPLNLENSKEARSDVYHLSSDHLCGIEFLKENGLLTVTQFKPKQNEDIYRNVVKFESIFLNGNDPTRTNGRIKGKAFCKISGDTIKYVTKVPVLTDGVKSPWALEELTFKLSANVLDVKLRASLVPIHRAFRSITACKFDLE